MRVFRAWLVVALIVLLPAGLILAGISVGARLDKAAVRSGPRSVAVPVEKVALDGAQPVTLALAWTTPAKLLAPAWTGTVTAVRTAPGTRIKTGTRLVQIDGVWRIAVRSASPLYAPVGPGSDRAQQKAALEVLQALGYVVSADRWDWRATRAMRALAGSLGVSASTEVSALDPGWFVWIPRGTLTAGAIDLAVGAPAPAPGTPIVELTPRLRSVSVDTEAGQTPPTLSMSSGASWVLRLAGVDLKVARFPIADADALTRLGDRLAAAHAGTVTGKISRSGSPRGWIVPTSSVFVDRNGRTCLVLVSPRAQALKTLTVDVLPGGEPGVASVTGDADGTLMIHSNPSRLAPPVRCS